MAVQDRDAAPSEVKLIEQYYVDKTPERDGTYRVHRQSCQQFPGAAIYLGCFESPAEAMRKARRYYVCVEECQRCCG